MSDAVTSPVRFVDPRTGDELNLFPAGLGQSHDEIRFPTVAGAVRTCGSQTNYTANFGLQWNKFAQTQLDSNCRLDLSRQRLIAETGWEFAKLAGENVLEVGSGAGRFTQVLLQETEAEIYSLDYSSAVEANFRNNGPNSRLHLFQASVFEMPFAPAQFDKVICLGVLQHTPDFHRSLQCLFQMVKPGGQVVVDFYPIRGWWTKWNAKYLLRPLAKKISPPTLLRIIDSNIDWLISAYRTFSHLGLGRLVNRFLPICDIDQTLPKNLSPAELREMCVLDTFDMFSPAYDQPQKLSTVVKWFELEGMEGVFGGFVDTGCGQACVVRGRKAKSQQ